MVYKLRSLWVNRAVIFLVWDQWVTRILSELQWRLIGSVQQFRK